MANKKAKIDKDGYVTFLNDDDGFSAKDYLLLVSTTVFFGFIVVGLIMVLIGVEIDKMYISLLEMTIPVVMTVVGGAMGVQAVESFSNRNKKEEENSYNKDQGI